MKLLWDSFRCLLWIHFHGCVYSWKVAYGWGKEIYACPLLSAQGTHMAQTPAGSVYAAIISMSSYVCQHTCLHGLIPCCTPSHPVYLLHPSCLCFCRVPWALRGGIWCRHLFTDPVSNVTGWNVEAWAREIAPVIHTQINIHMKVQQKQHGWMQDKSKPELYK